MAATAWSFFNQGKQKIADTGGIVLDAGIPKLSLHTSAAELNTSGSARVLSILSQVGGEIAAQGGYAAGGRTLSNVTWSGNGDPMSVRWDATDLIFTASGANLSNIKFAVIHFSAGAATSGDLLCWSRLSASQFSVTSGNTLTIQFAAAGIFTLT
jgi:hypothetical protein